MNKKTFRKTPVVISIYLLIVIVSAPLFISAPSQINQNSTLESEVVLPMGTISVVLVGRLIGMPGTTVRCWAIDGINTYDCTKTVQNSGTPIPYYLTCFVDLPYPGEYKLTASPVIPGFRGSSEIVYLTNPVVVTVELRIGIGPKVVSCYQNTILSSSNIYLK